MQCLTTYEMDAEWTFNLNDENCELPTRETNWYAWQILLEHVRYEATPEELTDGIETWCAEGWGGVGHTCTDVQIISEVASRGIPIGDLFDDDDILGCECVIDAIRDELKENAELKKENAELKKKVAELEEENEDYLAQVYKDGWKKGWEGEDICEGRYGTFGGCDGLSQAEAKVAELEKKMAYLEANNCEVFDEVQKYGGVCHQCENEKCQMVCTYCRRNEEECEKNKEGEKNLLTHWMCGPGYCCDDCYYKNEGKEEDSDADELCEAIDASGNALY